MSSDRLRVGVNLLFLEPGRRSGTATYSWALLDELADLDELDLVLFVQDGHVPDPRLAERCEVVSCPKFSGVIRRVAWEQLRLPSVARRHEIDVMFSTGYVSPLRGQYAKVTTVHDLYYARWPQAVPFVRRWYYRIFIRASVRVCDRIIAVSETTRDDLAMLLPASVGKTAVIHEAARATLREATPTLPDVEGPYFLVVASVTHNKNLTTVIVAAAEMNRRGVTAPVYVVGEDPYGLLATALAEHEAHGMVHMVGEVDDAELAGWYRGATAVIHPSRYEGFGLPALEAQAMGAPLISSRGGALPEVAGAGALFFDHERPGELVDAMTRVLDDPALRAELIEAGYHNLARFSWTDAATSTARVLSEAARKHR